MKLLQDLRQQGKINEGDGIMADKGFPIEDEIRNIGLNLNIPPFGQRKLTHVPIGLCTKFGELHPELRIFLNFSWVIVIYHFVGCSNVYLKIIVKYEIDHHIRDIFTRDLDFPIFLLIDFKF